MSGTTERRHAAMLAVGAALAALAACAPHLGPAPQIKPISAYAVTQSFSAPPAAWPQAQWWRGLGDPQLDALIQEALQGSPTLAQAEARLRRAQAQAEQARAALLPSLTANANVAEVRQSEHTGIPPQFVPRGWRDFGSGTLNLNWDFDLFGRNRAALRASAYEADAARLDSEQSRLMLTTSVVAAYGDLVRSFGARDAAQQVLANRQQSARLTQERARQGLSTRADAALAESGMAVAQSELAAADLQIGLTRDRLAALTGQGPDRGLAIERPNIAQTAVFGLPAGLAVDLLGRRPDVVAARLRAQAASRRVRAAQAAFYPDINLASYIGRQALGLNLLGQPGSTYGQVGLATSLPIFDGGRLSGALRSERADYDASVAGYDQTLTQALQDVADAAVNARTLQTRLDATRRALGAAEDASRIAQLRWRAGLISHITALQSEDAVIAQRRALADLQGQAVANEAALARALGGGFRASP